MSLFSKLPDSLRKFLGIAKERSTASTDNTTPSSNMNPEEIRQQFRRTFLSEVASFAGEDAAAQNNLLNPFLYVPMAVIAGCAGIVIGQTMVPVLIAGIAVRYFFICHKGSQSVLQTTENVVKKLKKGEDCGIPALEAWMDRNENQLPILLDRHERWKDDYRRAAQLAKRVNESRNTKDLSPEDKVLLKAQGYGRRLRPPISTSYRVTAGYILGAQSSTRLFNASQKGIRRLAGAQANVIGHVFGLDHLLHRPIVKRITDRWTQILIR